MGCAPSREDAGVKKAVVQNAKIDKQIRVDRKNEDRTVKILLLGKSLLRVSLIHSDKLILSQVLASPASQR
jgi:hypothetical protein